jgi:hypothetical protein
MTRRTVLPLLAAATTLGALAACDGLFERERAVLLPVQTLAAPATFTPGEAFTVTATVVSGGCRSFERLDGARAGDRLTLLARGREVSGPGVVCPADIRYEPRTFTVQPPFGDSIVVTAAQPADLAPVTRVVRAR